jgi:hypothetical protein
VAVVAVVTTDLRCRARSIGVIAFNLGGG